MEPTRLSQFKLIQALADCIQEQGITEACSRHYNSLIQASLLIINEFAVPYEPATPGMGLKKWLACDDVGQSSRWLASFLSGQFQSPYAHPHDPDDLNRCYKMIEAVPELKFVLDGYLAFPEKAPSKEWQVVFKYWEVWKTGDSDDVYDGMQTQYQEIQK